MKIVIDYTGDRKGFELNSVVDINIEEDAEALGYFLCVITSTKSMIEELSKTIDPKYVERFTMGVAKAFKEKEEEESDIWPFQNFKVTR